MLPDPVNLRSFLDHGQTGTNQIVGTKEMGLSAGLGPPPKLRDGFSSTLHEDPSAVEEYLRFQAGVSAIVQEFRFKNSRYKDGTT